MSRNRKSGESSFLGKLALGALGAIAGFAAYHIIKQANKEEVSQEKVQERSQQKKDSPYETEIDNYDQLEQLMTCPISQVIMVQPAIITLCGHTFQKKIIEHWIQKNGSCPLCKIRVAQQHVKVNFQLKQIIAQYKIKRQRQLNEKSKRKERH